MFQCFNVSGGEEIWQTSPLPFVCYVCSYTNMIYELMKYAFENKNALLTWIISEIQNKNKKSKSPKTFVLDLDTIKTYMQHYQIQTLYEEK